MKVAVVGATGLVGSRMIEVLQERNFPVSEFIPVASARSVGKELEYAGKKYKIVSMDDAIAMRPDIAIFSAGGDTSVEFAPKFAEVGTTVIDNSSAWRMDPTKKLVVPEINASELTPADKIIANPNCSTIQMVVALNELHKALKIERLIVSTYQSITGTGVAAVKQLEDERNGIEGEKAYPYEIDKNCLPHCDVFMENGYTKEEMKLVKEPKKIFSDDSIKITATAVRVPVVGGHSEAINVEFEKDFTLDQINALFAKTEGVVMQDDVANNVYPMCKFSEGKDAVFVGRVRLDESNPKAINFWCVSDNLRKGAATNAVQIAEYLVANKLVG